MLRKLKRLWERFISYIANPVRSGSVDRTNQNL